MFPKAYGSAPRTTSRRRTTSATLDTRRSRLLRSHGGAVPRGAYAWRVYGQVAGVGDYNAIHWLVGADTLDIRCLARGVYTATPARRGRPCCGEERSGRAARRASKPRAQHIIGATVSERKGWQ